MMPIINSIAKSIGGRSALASPSLRQNLIQRNRHALQGYHYTCWQASPRRISSFGSIMKNASRRFTSTGGAKSQKSKSNTLAGAVKSGTKESVSNTPSSSFSQFWRSYLEPVPMPERWTAAWYREMVLICTVFAITGSSTMVLVSRKVERTRRECFVMYYTTKKIGFL